MGHAPRGPVRPLGLALEEQLPAIHVPALELLDVAEPVQVALQVAGGHPVEGGQKLEWSALTMLMLPVEGSFGSTTLCSQADAAKP